MRRRVHLHGAFAGFHDGPIEIESDTVWDAVEAVTLQVKGFAPDPINGRKVIQVMGFPLVETLKTFDNTTEDIHIFPPLAFGKDGGLVQTIVGATLIVAGFLLPPGPWTAALFGAGLGMVLGGVMQMLSPQPQLSVGNEDQQRSKYLPNNQNTVAIGTPVPLLYGFRRVGGHIMSLNIDATDTGI